MHDSGGKFVILGRVESDDAQTMRGLPHMGSKKAVSEHVLWERSPLFGFPTRVMNVASTAFSVNAARLYIFSSLAESCSFLLKWQAEITSANIRSKICL
jgi:hypothetical protein